MKKMILAFIALSCIVRVNAQVNQKGAQMTRFGEAALVVPAADNFKPGLPNHNLQDPALAPLATTFINFDDITAPCTFVETVPLTNQFTSQGVTFSGSGFSLLDQCGSFGVSGYSPPNHVCWNMCCSGMFETLTFNTLVNNVTFLTGSYNGGDLSAEAFNNMNQSLGSVTVGLNPVMQLVSLPYTGISKVQISVTAANGILDDLTFETSGALPEAPISNWALLIGIGLILTFAVIRFRKMN